IRVPTLSFPCSRSLKICPDSVARRWRLGILPFAGFLCLFPGSAFPQTKAPSPSFAVLSKRADEARDGDRLEEAKALYTRALALRPTWVEGWWSLGTILYDQNSYPAAARAFGRLVSSDPTNGTAPLMLACCQYQLVL